MSDINTLNNSGIAYIGDSNAIQQAEKTLIVVGIARGGTSLVAGSLHHLGIFMGDSATPPVFEDMNLANAIETRKPRHIKQIIETHNQKHLIWGYKRPSIIKYLNKMHPRFRNPVYLFIFKDIFSVSNRNNISMQIGLIHGIRQAHRDYGKMLNFIASKEVNGCLLSYEKIMQDKEAFIDNLVQIIGADSISEPQRQAAIDFINPNPSDYLEMSRITRGKGSVDVVKPESVSGWARYINNERTATVELHINNQLVKTTKANHVRKDLKENGVHSSGKCAYHFDLHETPLKIGDSVNVKITDDVIFLSETNKPISE